MFCEEIKIPGLPGEGTVTDGSVDDKPCTAQDPCTDNSTVQTDDETYEIVQE